MSFPKRQAVNDAMPIHVRWDVDFGGRVGRAKRIARQIREIAPEVVELRIESDRGISELSAVFTEIHKAHPEVEATVRLTPKAAAAARLGYPIRFLWTIDPGEPFGRCIPEGARAVSFAPDEESIPGLPDLLEEFADSPAEELHLRNVAAVRALASKGHVPVPRPGQIREVSERIAASRPSMKGKRLVVHDYFLCRMLRDHFPGEAGNRVDFSGCRAGSRLAHVDWEGNVYPCDSLPIRLGNLLETSFAQIWRSPARRRIAEAIREVPADCDSCTAYVGCFGGCRGLAYLASGSFDSPGPWCDEEEKKGGGPQRVSGGRS
jgi:radical SAM protein with 4Fe4S-binding SPASM domain